MAVVSQSLTRDLEALMLLDQARLKARIQRMEARGKPPSEREVAALRLEVRCAREKLEVRRRLLPVPSFPGTLAIEARRSEIATAIAAHPVVIVCGETGSGKTTQIPKICLDLKRGVQGMIGCTQPRRLAARSVAARLSAELDSEIGNAVGYKIRFTDRVREQSYVKVMTDGVLLAEIHSDRELKAYDTLIIDEAHERSLNIDFLLGYLKRLLPRRPELKVIITSATIDSARFARHFESAPVIEVSGRTYAVEVHYRPAQDGANEVTELKNQVVRALDEVYAAEGQGDVLIFLPGEREIRATAEALRKHPRARVGSATEQIEILPLYARLSVAEQDRIFRPGAARRIVLATNVAETSLTVPRIRYVIDSGLARINRYALRSKVNQLQIEKISQAAAKQRAGRCGRVANGICIRLYSEDDFAARPAFTTPEILRTSLAGVILRMQALELGAVEQFPFIDPPSARSIAAGYQLLSELGALDAQGTLNSVGHELARLPLDPKIGRMLLAAGAANCLSEVLVIAAALSVSDPRERPLAQRALAVESQRQFEDQRSEFLSYLKLWQFFQAALKHKKSNRKLAQLCRDNFLSYTRMLEWRDIYAQLHALVAEMGMRLNAAVASYEHIHRALLTGLLGHIGVKDSESDGYLGARQTKFWLAAGNLYQKQKPKWVTAAELTHTTRLYARCAARIEPEWIEAIAMGLLERSYFDPHWDKEKQQVIAFERVSLYGLSLVAKRRVAYASIDPSQARAIFIRSALVAAELKARPAFLQHNLALIEEIEALEHKSRRPDMLVDDEAIFRFYDSLIPEGIYTVGAFEQWRGTVERENPELLYLARDDLMRYSGANISEALYPDTINLSGVEYRLRYRFDPGHALDGVSVTLPLYALNQVNPTRFEWLVPGFLREKITLLLKSLPQRLRRELVPLPTYVTQCMVALESVDPEITPLANALSQYLERNSNLVVTQEEWQSVDLPRHLLMNFRIVRDSGEELAIGRDFAQLRDRFAAPATDSFRARAAIGFEREGIKAWDFGDLPGELELTRNGTRLLAYPALVDCANSVALRLFDSREHAERATRSGLLRLFMLALPQQLKYFDKQLSGLATLCLLYAAAPDAPEVYRAQQASLAPCDELKRDLIAAVCETVFLNGQPALSTESAFSERHSAGKARLATVGEALCHLLHAILVLHKTLQQRLSETPTGPYQRSLQDIKTQLAHLVFRGFVRRTPAERLREFPRYLKALQLRLDKLRFAPERDWQHTAEITGLWQNYLRCAANGEHNQALEDFRWLIEELRVSLFAQALRTPVPISVKRLQKQWQDLAQLA